MPGSWIARSISRPVEALLQRCRSTGRWRLGRVLAVFEQACHIVTPTGEILALVTPQLGDGPLNIVVEGAGEGFALPVALPVWLLEERLRVGRWEVLLGQATLWEPRPDWERLRASCPPLAGRWLRLEALTLAHAPADSLVPLVADWAGEARPALSGHPAGPARADLVRDALDMIRAGWMGDPERLRAGVEGLAGLGGGLTPAGDDLLCGLMVRAWLAHPRPASFCLTVVETAAPRTTALSAALLRAAGRGECSAAWHRLLEALVGGDQAALAGAVQAVLAHGATSGGDALAGFLWGGNAEDSVARCLPWS